MMSAITGILMIMAIGIAVIASIFIPIVYLHERSLRKHREKMEYDYERELMWQQARHEELAREQHNAKLDEINRDYMDAIKAMELMEELERDKHDIR